MKIYVFLKNGFEEIEAITIADYLRRTGTIVELVSFEENLVVTGGHKINILADMLAEEIEITKDTAIFLPGGMLQMLSLKADKKALDYIRKANQLGALLIAICASTLVLEEAGVIKNKVVTSYPGLEKDLKSIKKYSEKNVVRDGNIITSRGPQTASDLAYFLIEVIKGKELKEKIMDDTLYCLNKIETE